MNAQSSEEITQFFTALAKEQFPGLDTQIVRVDDDRDIDGDPIYRVYVAFPNARDLEKAKISGFARMAALRLDERNDFHFPLFSFMTKADSRKISAAP